jgi:transcription elongation factor Elf1
MTQETTVPGIEELQAAVDLINKFPNRPSDKVLIRIVHCQFCGYYFPVAVQDYNKNKGLLTCGNPGCREKLVEQRETRSREKLANAV